MRAADGIRGRRIGAQHAATRDRRSSVMVEQFTHRVGEPAIVVGPNHVESRLHRRRRIRDDARTRGPLEHVQIVVVVADSNGTAVIDSVPLPKPVPTRCPSRRRRETARSRSMHGREAMSCARREHPRIRGPADRGRKRLPVARRSRTDSPPRRRETRRSSTTRIAGSARYGSRSRHCDSMSGRNESSAWTEPRDAP